MRMKKRGKNFPRPTRGGGSFCLAPLEGASQGQKNAADFSVTKKTSPRHQTGKPARVLLPKTFNWRKSMETLFEEETRLENFSLNTALLREILDSAKPLGHNEKPDNLNLGFGFLYYGLVRALRPRHLVVIGSGFGFSVVCFALGMKDNKTGMLTFVDPSYSLLKNGPLKTIGGKNNWSEPLKVEKHFKQFGVEDIVTHYKLKSDQFFASYKALGLPKIDIAFIDGNHSYENVKSDFLNAVCHVHKNSYILLHDSNIYVREFIGHAGVKKWLKVIGKEKKHFEIIDFPFSSGMALVRILRDRSTGYEKEL